jgi:aminoglycoside phosphotransferase family enzyme
MNLQEAFEQGKVLGINGKPDRVIETLISKLYFFGDDVYKVYKYNKAFFGDFSDDRFRHEFYHNDFTWNNTMAPDIYLKLGYMKKNKDTFIEATHDTSEDYYILMKKIDDSQTLFNLIRKNNFKKEDLELITSEMFDRTEKLTEIKRTDTQDLFDMSYVDLDLQNLESTREWLYMTPDFIPKDEADSIINNIKNFVATYPYFMKFDKKGYLASIDNHGGNILFTNGKVNFIDSMPPMRIWRIQSDAYSISRPATDLEVLAGKEYADVMFEKFEEIRNTKLDPKVRAYLQVVAALIQAPYLYVLREVEFAQKFWNFAKRKVQKLK